MKTEFPPAKIAYLADASVDAGLDRELRELLSTCFTKPQDHVFKVRRYFNDLPAHRWIIRDEENGRMVAHLALHDRVVIADGVSHTVGGIAEVCVHPTHQGRGYLRQLVAAAHAWMAARGYAFSVLYGEPRYYSSSGYLPVENLFLDARADDGQLVRQRASGALIAPLSDEAWPSAEVYMPGLIF